MEIKNPNNLEGWDGEVGGREVQDGGAYIHLWLIHVDIQNQHYVVKQLSSN